MEKIIYVVMSQKKFNKQDTYKVFASNSLELVNEKIKNLPKIKGRKYVVSEVACQKVVMHHV